MCGICGYISDTRVSREALTAMNDTIIYRGPDDSGIWESRTADNNYYVGLAHRRLSILDLSMAGHQPMVSSDGQTIIVYNGEIYNFKDIKRKLVTKGCSFKSQTDTEVVLQAYKTWGNEAFNKFNGMFAIAIYNIATEELTLVRDKIGKKPLYYYVNGGTLIFGSELKPIMACPLFEKKIDFDSLNQFFCAKYIVSPYTIFENTYKLEPGSYITFNKGIITDSKKYWNLVELHNRAIEDRDRISDLDVAKRELNDLLEDSISKRLVADVPVGCFLSGGIDSSLTSAIAKKSLGKSIDTFTIGFDDLERNEAPQAAKIAENIGTNHHEKYITMDDVFGMVDDFVTYYDEPFADSSLFPTMLVSDLAKKDVTVAISGDAGDELFCGYRNYDYTWVVQKIDWMGATEHAMPWNDLFVKRCGPRLRAIINNRDKNYKVQCYNDVFNEAVEDIFSDAVKTKLRRNPKFEIESQIKAKNFQDKHMVLDMMTYLPDEILVKVDRASMKYSLESRCPITDHRIVEWSFKVDHKLKYHNFDKKYLLKQLAYEYIPKELLDGPKRGFGVPLKKWLRNELKSEIDRYVDKRFIEEQGIFNAEAIIELQKNQAASDNRVYTNLLWEYYVFQRWYEKYA